MTRTIKIHYDNGDTVTTRINATVDEIVKWYNLGLPIVVSENFETGEEYRAAARSIEFLDNNYFRNSYTNTVTELKRIYSISEKYQTEHCLENNLRFTGYEITDLFGARCKHDAAYTSGKFVNDNGRRTTI